MKNTTQDGYIQKKLVINPSVSVLKTELLMNQNVMPSHHSTNLINRQRQILEQKSSTFEETNEKQHPEGQP